MLIQSLVSLPPFLTNFLSSQKGVLVLAAPSILWRKKSKVCSFYFVTRDSLVIPEFVAKQHSFPYCFQLINGPE